MKKCRNKSWESEWYWSKVWKVSLTTYESDPENTVFPPISLLDGCPVLKVSEILRLDRLFLILHVPSSVSISFVTSKKHKFWQSRFSVSSFDSFWFLTKWFLIYKLYSFWLLRISLNQSTVVAKLDRNIHCSWFLFAYIDHYI